MAAIAAHKLQLIRTLVETAPDAALRSLELALAGTGAQSIFAPVRELVEDETANRFVRNNVLAPIVPLCAHREEGAEGDLAVARDHVDEDAQDRPADHRDHDRERRPVDPAVPQQHDGGDEAEEWQEHACQVQDPVTNRHTGGISTHKGARTHRASAHLDRPIVVAS